MGLRETNRLMKFREVPRNRPTHTRTLCRTEKLSWEKVG